MLFKAFAKLALTKDVPPGSIAKWIVSTWEDKLKYATLCRNAYSRCIKVMNWDSWSQKVKEIVKIELK